MVVEKKEITVYEKESLLKNAVAIVEMKGFLINDKS